jgi:hypothetical protein
MKKILTAALVIQSLHSHAQDAIYNNGSTIQVNGHATLQVNGDFVNNAGSQFNNEGNTIVQGGFVNHQYMSAAFLGSMHFNGNTQQAISGSAGLLVNHFFVNNPMGVSVTDTLLIAGNIYFTNGIVLANDATKPIVLTASSNLGLGASHRSHINGWMVKQGPGNFTYPVGDGTKYQPINTNLTQNSNGMLVKYTAANAGIAPFASSGTVPTALLSYNSNEYWEVKPWSNGTAEGTVTVFWDGYNDVFPNPISQRQVAHLFGGNWLNEGQTAFGDSAAGYVTSNLLNYFNRFTLGSTGNVLPLHLLSFTGIKKTGYNQLLWHTTREEQTHHFVLERSIDGLLFGSIATIAAAGTGNNSYQYNDEGNFGNRCFYRLKIIDHNGSYTYSKTVVLAHSSENEVSIYPNPVINTVNIISGSSLRHSEAMLIDAAGRAVLKFRFNNAIEKLNLTGLVPGTYMLVTKNNTTYKLIKQ